MPEFKYEPFDEAMAEAEADESQEPLWKEIKGERFEWPFKLSGKQGLDFMRLVAENNGIIHDHEAARFMLDLLGDEKQRDRLGELLDADELETLTDGLMQHYKLFKKVEDEAGDLPNRQARRAARKQKPSSSTSSQSRPTSSASTG